MKTTIIQPKIQKLENVEEIGALLPKDVVNGKRFGKMYLFSCSSDGCYYFIARDGKKALLHLESNQRDISLDNGSLVLKNPIVTRIWFTDRMDYDFFNKRLTGVGM